MPGFSLVGVSSIVTGTTSITLSEPAGTQEEDYLLAVFGGRGNAGDYTNVDFSYVMGDPAGNTATNNTGRPAFGVFSARRGSSAPGLTWTRSGAGSFTSQGVLLVYRGNPLFSFSVDSEAGSAVATGTRTVAQKFATAPGPADIPDVDDLSIAIAFEAGTGTTGEIVQSTGTARTSSGTSGTVAASTPPSATAWQMRVRNTAGASGNASTMYVADVIAFDGDTPGNVQFVPAGSALAFLGLLGVHTDEASGGGGGSPARGFRVIVPF